MENPAKQLLCCDLKVDQKPPKKSQVPPWADSPAKPIEVCRPDKQPPGQTGCGRVDIPEKARFRQFSKSQRMNVDLVFGLTGGREQTRKPGKGPETGVPVYEIEDLHEWLLDGKKDAMYLVSGSTKTAEFRSILDWLGKALKRKYEKKPIWIQHGKRRKKLLDLEPGIIPDKIGVESLRVTVESVNNDSSTGLPKLDPDVFLKKLRRNFSDMYTFTLPGKKKGRKPVVKKVHLIFYTKPVNFMFHGTPAEVLDWTYAQLIDVTAMLGIAYRDGTLPKPAIIATDYRLAASTGILNEAKPPLTKNYPVPDVLGMPLTVQKPRKQRKAKNKK